jgi:hypothetical protein
MKTTLNIDDDLYRALKSEAALDGVPVQEVLDAALRQWLEQREAGDASVRRIAESPGDYRTTRAVPARDRLRPAAGARPRLTREQVLARWRNLPSYDPADLRRDLDRTFDTSL